MKKPPAKMLKYLDEARAPQAANKLSKAAQSARHAYKIAEEYLPLGHPSRLEVASTLGLLLINLGDRETGEKLLREAGQLPPDADAEDQVVASNQESALLMGREITRETARQIEETAEYARQQLPEENPHRILARANLGKLRLRQEHFREAERIFTEVLMQHRECSSLEPLLVNALQDLAALQLSTGRPELAEPLYREALERHEALATEDLTTHTLLGGLASACGNQGRFDEAVDLLRRCVTISRESLGETHERTELDLLTLAGALKYGGRLLEMTQALSSAADILDATIGPLQSKSVMLRCQIAKFQIELGPEEAQKAFEYLSYIQPIMARSAPPEAPIQRSSADLLRRAEAAAKSEPSAK